MASIHLRPIVASLLFAGAPFFVACGPSADREPAPEPEASRELAAPEPGRHELDPEPRIVELEARDERPPAEPAPAEEELAAREREIERREAEVRERERRLAERRPEPPRPPAPAPAPERPAEEVAAAEPAPDPRGEEAPGEPSEQPSEEIADRAEPIREERAIPVTVPAGTRLDVEFLQSLASDGNAAGDTFRVRVASDVSEGGVVAIPAGSEILGVVEEAVRTKTVGGRARLVLRFTDLVLPSGSTVPIDASFVEEARSETARDAATIGGSAAGGAILGRVLGGGKDRDKRTVIGAVLGAAIGTAIASRTPGEEIVIPQGTVLTLSLDRAIEVRRR
jgi:type IV secretory pathway VirB10-like protein